MHAANPSGRVTSYAGASALQSTGSVQSIAMWLPAGPREQLNAVTQVKILLPSDRDAHLLHHVHLQLARRHPIGEIPVEAVELRGEHDLYAGLGETTSRGRSCAQPRMVWNSKCVPLRSTVPLSNRYSLNVSASSQYLGSLRIVHACVYEHDGPCDDRNIGFLSNLLRK